MLRLGEMMLRLGEIMLSLGEIMLRLGEIMMRLGEIMRETRLNSLQEYVRKCLICGAAVQLTQTLLKKGLQFFLLFFFYIENAVHYSTC